jgi:GDP-4-dehydro-6-deoxy-D-mannose reductase
MIVRTFTSENFRPYIVRPFNHTGPGQSTDFVCPGLAKKIAEAPDGGTVKVGNLDAWRDFTDVRDVVRAYRLVLEKRPEEDLFVVGSGKAVQIREVWDRLVKLSGKNLKFEVEKTLLRAKEPQTQVAATKLAEKILGWRPKYEVPEILRSLFPSPHANS